MHFNPYYLFSYCFFFCLGFFLTGCTLNPAYQRPDPMMITEWKEVVAQPTCCLGGVWWEVFEDPLLNDLEMTAIKNNQNLKAAAARLSETRFFASMQQANLIPALSLQPAFQNSNSLIEAFLPPNLLSSVFPTAIPSTGFVRTHQQLYQLTLNLNYEVDLWGKLRNASLAAFATAEAQEEALKTVLLTVTTDVAHHYYSLRQLDREIELIHAQIDSQKATIEIEQDNFQSGFLSLSELTDAQLSLLQLKSELADLIKARTFEENVLALLLGRSASEFSIEESPLLGQAPSIPVGLPSDLMKRRPDINEAERTLAARYAEINVAYAAFFPSLQLTAGYGSASPALQYFMKDFSNFSSLGANLFQSIFAGGKHVANLEVAKARHAQAWASYQQQVFIAFKEVEDTLTSLDAQKIKADIHRQAVQIAQESMTSAKDRNQQGLADYLEVTRAEQIVLKQERDLVQIQAQQFILTMQLIKAIGGGWET